MVVDGRHQEGCRAAREHLRSRTKGAGEAPVGGFRLGFDSSARLRLPRATPSRAPSRDQSRPSQVVRTFVPQAAGFSLAVPI